jgi:colicin import membrane protein
MQVSLQGAEAHAAALEQEKKNSEDALVQDKAKLQVELKGLQTQCEKLKVENAALTADIAKLNLALGQAEGKCVRMAEEQNRAQEAAKALETAKADLEQRLTARSSAADAAETEKQKITSALEEERETNRRLRDELSQLQQAQAQLEQTKADLQVAYNKLEERKRGDNDTLQQLEQKSAQLIVEKQELERDMANARAELESRLKAQEEEHVRVLQAEREKYAELLRTSSEKDKQLADRSTLSTSQLEAQNAAKEQLEQRLASLQTELDQARQHSSKMSAQAVDVQGQLDQLVTLDATKANRDEIAKERER